MRLTPPISPTWFQRFPVTSVRIGFNSTSAGNKDPSRRSSVQGARLAAVTYPWGAFSRNHIHGVGTTQFVLVPLPVTDSIRFLYLRPAALHSFRVPRLPNQRCMLFRRTHITTSVYTPGVRADKGSPISFLPSFLRSVHADQVGEYHEFWGSPACVAVSGCQREYDLPNLL